MTQDAEIPFSPPSLTEAQALELFNKEFSANNLKERLAAPSANTISTAGKMFTFSDGRTDHGPLKVIVLDWVATNSYFDGEYDPQKRVPPACFAVGPLNNDALVPVDESPNKQHDDCGTCPHNQFGSRGKGKACKNNYKLAIIPSDLQTPDTDKVWSINVSPTGIKQFTAFVKNCEKLFGVPHPIRVAVDMQFSSAHAYPTLEFVNPKLHENLGIALSLRDYAQEVLMRKPNFTP